jgi:hypothetical protein
MKLRGCGVKAKRVSDKDMEEIIFHKRINLCMHYKCHDQYPEIPS